jgi:hypothetical protein
MSRVNPIDEREPLAHEGDPDHPLRKIIHVNGVKMRAAFASYREQAECLPVLTRPWNADGRTHPEIVKLHEYHAARHTLDVLGYPVVVEFDDPADALKGLAAYLDAATLAPAPAPTRRPRASRTSPASATGGSDNVGGEAQTLFGDDPATVTPDGDASETEPGDPDAGAAGQPTG